MTGYSNIGCLIGAFVLSLAAPCKAQTITREKAMRAAIHPVSSESGMRAWLARIPLTRHFPPDFADTLRGQGSAFAIEMSTAPGCVPCGDMWIKVSGLGGRYGFRVATLGSQDAMLRSGRLGLPWVGHPVVWVRPIADPNRMVPVAVGTDLEPNLARNVYLAVKMLTGVRPDVGLRAMSKYTGIVGAGAPRTRSN